MAIPSDNDVTTPSTTTIGRDQIAPYTTALFLEDRLHADKAPLPSPSELVRTLSHKSAKFRRREPVEAPTCTAPRG